MKICVPVYITPEKGETVIGIAKAISEAKASGKIGDIVFFNLPDGKVISIVGDTEWDIVNSIATQWSGDGKF